MGAISSHRSAFQPQQSEEKCTVVQERLDLAEKKLAQFSEKPVTAAEECLAQVDETNDDALDINSLHDEIILEIFGYLTQNQLGQIASKIPRITAWHAFKSSISYPFARNS